MIQSFLHEGLRRFFESGDGRGLPPQQLSKIELILDTIDAAASLDDLNLPGLNLHPLTGNRKNEPVRWAVKVTGNYRITFEFEESEGDASKVDYEDYH